MKQKILPLFICCITLTFNSYSQTKEQSIRKLIHAMQQDSLLNRTLHTLFPQFLLVEKDAAKREWMMKKFINIAPHVEQMNKIFVEKEVVPVYDKYFTHKEIKGLVRFYESKLGKKTLSNTPYIAGDLIKILMEKYLPEMQKAILLD